MQSLPMNWIDHNAADINGERIGWLTRKDFDSGNQTELVLIWVNL
jgi:hypothetical protein